MQNTDFAFEVLINDDASSDGTREILKEYASRYPEKIKPNYQKNNKYSEGKRNFIIRYLLPHAKGEYLAVCEGDDYWTNPNKLQKQVDFLDKHPDYALCFHPVRVVFESGEHKDSIFPKKTEGFTAKELLKGNFIQTNSVMYRKQEYKSVATDVMPGDWYLHLYHAQFGKIGFINDPMAVYRRHAGGIWWNSYNNLDKVWQQHGLAHLALYREQLKIYGHDPQLKRIIHNTINKMLENLVELDRKKGTELINAAIKDFPSEFAAEFILSQHKTILNRNKKIQKDKQEIDTQNHAMNVERSKRLQKEAELANIKNSRFWKSRNKVVKMLGRDAI
jgi:glycosyltransferase involved in cell wall biosynthesis